jgi:hypothetical protein
MMLLPHSNHAYRPPRPVTGIALPFSYVDDVRTSQETYVWDSTACYGDSITPYM